MDGTGQALNGARHGYQLTFPAGEIPQAKRFWSLTAYVPGTIELVPNRADKYLVASYTPGLVTNPDGSITIYMAPTQPAGVPMANWLPVPRGHFSVILRAYGPTGNTAARATPRQRSRPRPDRTPGTGRNPGARPHPPSLLAGCARARPAARPPQAPRRQSFAAPTPLQVITDTYAET